MRKVHPKTGWRIRRESERQVSYGLTTSIVRGTSLRLASSLSLGWKGFGVERHRVPRGFKEETLTDLHVMNIASGEIASHGERVNSRGRFESYVKEPGSIGLFSSGVLPAIRPATETELIVCAFERGFVDTIAGESDIYRVPEAPIQEGLHDHATTSLGKMLASEAHSGGVSGQLYVDHLAHALVLRLLSLWKLKKAAPLRDLSLPTRALRRVLERMQSDPSVDLSLETLARESGFSRNHFIRMFRKSTGFTPHRYLLHLRVERAKSLMKKKDRLIDVAASCGFSSDAQLSRAFRSLLGVSPSEYRREILG